jgi:hypothetical protein
VTVFQPPAKKQVREHAYEMLYLLSWCCRGIEFAGPAGLRLFTIPERILKRARELTADLRGEVNTRYLNPDFTHNKDRRKVVACIEK